MADVAADKLAKLQQIQAQGPSVEVGAMRLRLLKEMIGARVDQPAEYAILVGCNATFRFFHVKSFVDLLERLDVSYSFLSKEFCCGNSYLPKSDQIPELATLEPYAQDYQGRNIAAAEALGAQAVVTFCANCNARYRRHLRRAGPPILYWTDLVSAKAGGLKLDKKVDFYEGCHRDQNVVLPGAIDAAVSKNLLSGIQGLSYNEVSSDLCCKQKAADIFIAMKTDVLVTPTSCCYGTLFKSRPSGTRVAFLTDLLLLAVENL